MILFIDCEFNGYKGELLSMALVPLEEGVGSFYLEINTPVDLVPWVMENVVITYRGDLLVPYAEFQKRLSAYLARFDEVHIVADWPDDITYFTQALITGPGTRINTPPLTLEIRRDLDAVSEIPHMALADALAMRDTYVEMNYIGEFRPLGKGIVQSTANAMDGISDLIDRLANAHTKEKEDESLDTTIVQATVVERDPEHAASDPVYYMPVIVPADNDLSEQEQARYNVRKEFILHGKPHIAYGE